MRNHCDKMIYSSTFLYNIYKGLYKKIYIFIQIFI